jgi:hypothetical protein
VYALLLLSKQEPACPEDGTMSRAGGKQADRRASTVRKELFRAEDLTLEWREMRKAVSGVKAPPQLA